MNFNILWGGKGAHIDLFSKIRSFLLGCGVIGGAFLGKLSATEIDVLGLSGRG